MKSGPHTRSLERTEQTRLANLGTPANLADSGGEHDQVEEAKSVGEKKATRRRKPIEKM